VNLLVVGIVRDELKLAAPWIVVRFGLDHTSRIGDHRSSLQVIREIIENSIGALARDALTVEENIFVGQVSAQVALAHDSRRHVPVKCSGAAVGLYSAVAVGIVGIRISGGAGEAVFLVVSVGRESVNPEAEF
jgi:hypothetical protein